MSVWRINVIAAIATVMLLPAQIPVFFLGWWLGTAMNSMAPVLLLEFAAFVLTISIGKRFIQSYEMLAPETTSGFKRYGSLFGHIVIVVGVLLVAFAVYLNFFPSLQPGSIPQSHVITSGELQKDSAMLGMFLCIAGTIAVCSLSNRKPPPNSTLNADARPGP